MRAFETFPFPIAWEANPALEEIGRQYYEFRAALMVRNNEGLTKTYNPSTIRTIRIRTS
jgi:hypothetical protein